MSQSKNLDVSLSKECGSGTHPASVFNTPVIAGRFDRFCANCSCIIENMALERYKGLKCPRCDREVDNLGNADGNFRRCVRCFVHIKCTSKFCDLCGRHNQFYDPNKPTRMEKALESKIRESVKRELEFERENLELSQSCVEDDITDGLFGTDADGVSAKQNDEDSKGGMDTQEATN